MQLNEKQQEVVDFFSGQCVVTAGPGSGKCITGDSIVFSPENFSEIQSKSCNEVIGLDSEDINNGKFKNIAITEFVDSGLQNTIKIETKSGFELEGTFNHKIVVLNRDGKLLWKSLEDISIGDVCPIYIDKSAKKITFDDEAYWIGLMLGDGCLVDKNVFRFSSEDNNGVSLLFCIILKKVFNMSCAAYKDKRRSNLYAYTIGRKDTRKLKSYIIKKYGDICKYAKDKCLTEEILSLPYSSLGSLMRGMFDTDGYCDKSSCGIMLSSKKLIFQLQVVLLKYGIFSTRRIKIVKGKEYYRLQIFGDDYRRFVELIGFNHNKKREVSKEILSKTRNPNKIIPYMQKHISSIRNDVAKFDWCSAGVGIIRGDKGDSVRLARYENTCTVSRNVTSKTCEKIIKICNKYNFYSDSLYYLDFLNSNFMFDTIKVKKNDRAQSHVYDYYIEKSHNFVANGFINHNTACLVERVATLINKGVNPSRILCLTFTNKAANEMRERICKRLNIDDASFYIGTFHSLCVKILRRVGTKIGYAQSFSIFDSNDQISLLKSITRQMGFDVKKMNFYGISHKINFGRELLEDENTISQRFEDSADWDVAKKYLEEIKDQNAIDFSGLLYETVRLLKANDDVLGRLQNQFEYILVDEIQDTNYAQFELVNFFAGKHKNVMVVGDINQSVYGFRGARYQNVLDFIKEYKGCKQISLGKNYRSTPEIVAVASKLIKKNNSLIDIKFETDNDSGQEPQYSSHYDQTAEARAVAKKIKFLVEDEGWEHSDISVFYRLNRMSLEIQTALANNSIPFTVIGGPSFFDRKEIRDCLGMLRWLANSYDKIAFHRVIDMFSDIGDVTYSRIVEVSQSNNISLMEACSRIDDLTNRQSIIKAAKRIQAVFDFDFSSMHAGKALSLLISKIGYYKHLDKTSKNNKDYEDRKGNVEELINNATIFGQVNSSISDYLRNIALVSSSDKESTASVSLMTIHASKGLEFPIVFIIGVEEGIHPHIMALKEAKTPEERVEAVEEETRVFYVGITRAERRLYVSSCENRLKSPWGKPELIKSEPSRFISYAGLR